MYDVIVHAFLLVNIFITCSDIVFADLDSDSVSINKINICTIVNNNKDENVYRYTKENDRENREREKER